MLGLGAYNPLPMTLGGGDSTLEVLHGALLERYAPGWDVTDESIKNAEAYAEALCLDLVWACNARLSNQWKPEKLMEWLDDWEAATKTRPTFNENAVERRAAVAAKFRGATGNSITDIIDVCAAIAGDYLDEVVTCPTNAELNYWPGVNPGPPGLEWATNRFVLGIKLTVSDSPTGGSAQLREKLYRALDNVVPAWMRVVIGSGDDFNVGVDLVGGTIL